MSFSEKLIFGVLAVILALLGVMALISGNKERQVCDRVCAENGYCQEINEWKHYVGGFDKYDKTMTEYVCKDGTSFTKK